MKILNLVTLKVGAKHELLFNKPALSRTLAAQQSVIKFIAMTVINLVTPKAAAKQKLLFNKPASVVLQKNFVNVNEL